MQFFDIELEYTPSCWSKRFNNSKETLLAHLSCIREGTKAARTTLKHEVNVPYGNGPSEVFDIYGSELPENAPLFVFVHGGFWQECSKNDYGFHALQMVPYGYKVVVPEYPLCPDVTLYELVKIMKRFIKWIIDYAKNQNAMSITLCGHSAGAHLIACCLNEISTHPYADLVKDIYLLSGVYDIKPLQFTNAVNKNNLLGLCEHDETNISPIYDRLQSINLVTNIYVHVGSDESNEFKKQSIDYFEKLKKTGYKCMFRLITDCDHFQIVEELKTINCIC